jgi:hypothetical protein
MKKLFIALVALTLVAPILAQEPVPDELPPLGEAARNGVITFLQLTEDQIATWEGLLDTRELAMEPIRARHPGRGRGHPGTVRQCARPMPSPWVSWSSSVMVWERTGPRCT